MLRSENVCDDDVVEKAGMASPALAVMAALASRRSSFCFRARAFLPDIALEGFCGVSCARRCASRLPRKRYITTIVGFGLLEAVVPTGHFAFRFIRFPPTTTLSGALRHVTVSLSSGGSSKRGRDDTEVKAERGDGIGEDLDEGEALPHRPHHRLFVGNSETCEVVELHMRGSDIRVTDWRVGKAWADSKTFTKKPPKGWLTGIAHHRGLLYCLQYVGGLGRKSNVGCFVVLDAENELRYERKYVLPFQSPEGIAIRDEYVYVSLAESQIVRFSMTAEGRIDMTPESQTRCALASTGVCK